MGTSEIISQIKLLPLEQRFFVMEETLKSIKNFDTKQNLEIAAKELYDDYSYDKELTAFTSLDIEDFYETK